MSHQGDIAQEPPRRDTRFGKGSRAHVLRLLDDAAYFQRMNALLRSGDTTFGCISASDKRQPLGSKNPNEWEIENFCKENCQGVFDSKQLENWWLPAQSRTPKGATWDIISTCTIQGKHGLLLVEAKAHERELGRGGKTKPSGSAQSAFNHQQIRTRLSEVTTALRAGKWKVRINEESHYQLANRVAWAWKLAQCGVPVILLYLGFIGDKAFPDHFVNPDHWQRTMGAYMDGVVPLNLPENRIAGSSDGSFVLLIRSLDAQVVTQN